MAQVDPYAVRPQLLYGVTPNNELVYLRLSAEGKLEIEADVAPGVPQAVLTQAKPNVTTTSSVVSAAKTKRKYLLLQNVGLTDITLGFGATAIVGSGFVLPAALAAGKAGGTLVFDSAVTAQAIHAIVATGTGTLNVVEG